MDWLDELLENEEEKYYLWNYIESNIGFTSFSHEYQAEVLRNLFDYRLKELYKIKRNMQSHFLNPFMEGVLNYSETDIKKWIEKLKKN